MDPLSTIFEASYAEADAALESILDRIQTARTVVIGDVMLDEFIFGAVQRISPEAPWRPALSSKSLALRPYRWRKWPS